LSQSIEPFSSKFNKTQTQHVNFPADRLRMQFMGAAGFVTGSRTLLETHQTRIYIDTGLYQGETYISDKNYQKLESNPRTIDAIILTHAHVDHSGLVPLLIKRGFAGPVFCTPATHDLLHILWPDSGRLHEEEFRFLSKKKIRDYEIDGPLYTEEDAIKALDSLQVVDFNNKNRFREFEFEYFWAGHILGAAHLRVEAHIEPNSTELQNRNVSVLFSGDVGPLKPIFHRAREIPQSAQNIIIESTYGDKLYHRGNYEEKLIECVKTIVMNRGMLVIPSFAVGRAQVLLYVLYALVRDRKIPPIPIYLDSPMASKATSVYLNYPEEIRQEIIDDGFIKYLELHERKSHTRQNLRKRAQLNIIQSVAMSKELNTLHGPGIIISASGMCNGGRILHHLTNRLWDRRNMILFVGYQAVGTLGRQIVEGHGRVKIFNQEVMVRARVTSISAFSAHADQNGLVEYLKSVKSGDENQRYFINHGEDEPREVLHQTIIDKLKVDKENIEVPKSQSVYYL